MSLLEHYRYGGARALVLLHDNHLRSYLVIWQQANAAGVTLPETNNSNYASLETLHHHVLASARGYMNWICENLQLPDPQINEAPDSESIGNEGKAYVEHILERWRLPLADTEPQRFREIYTSTWGIEFSIDSMLEHAVMHPIRHEFQLGNLIAGDQRQS